MGNAIRRTVVHLRRSSSIWEHMTRITSSRASRDLNSRLERDSRIEEMDHVLGQGN